MLIGQSRKCLTHIADTCIFVDKSLSGWHRFLSTFQWDLSEVIKSMINLLLSELGDSLSYAGHLLLAVDPDNGKKGEGKNERSSKNGNRIQHTPISKSLGING